jgi:hypothetical protein
MDVEGVEYKNRDLKKQKRGRLITEEPADITLRALIYAVSELCSGYSDF